MSVKTVEVDELNALMIAGKVDIVYDVRESNEYQMVRVPQAKNLPLSSFSPEQVEEPKNRAIYLICHSGQRSLTAAVALESAGYTEVYNVVGGTAAWEHAGYETAFG
ncbi:MAG: rhodanese-like domain-containing protein [Zetaproteobacteria bacterium]|nr:rhodanese-like domain-containing protein [Zetaproteobacteria bacterium]